MKKIVVFALKGGVGKSTLAIQLVAEISKTKRVSICDFDQQQRLANWTAAYQKLGKKGANNICSLEDKADYLVFDTTPIFTQEALGALGAADLVLVPTGLGQEELEPVKIVHKILLSECSGVKAGLVVVRNDTRTKLQSEFFTALDAELIAQRITPMCVIGSLPAKVVWQRLGNSGKSIEDFGVMAAFDWFQLNNAILKFLNRSAW